MFFIQSFGFEIKLGKSGAFQEWLTEHEGEWRAAMPEGTEYIGTFAAVMSSEKQAGDSFTLYRLDSYGAMDRLAAALKDGPLAKVMADSSQFIDFESKNWSQMLLKSWIDATVWDPAEG